jgi:two-component system sensor histidine kinase/response regulator
LKADRMAQSSVVMMITSVDIANSSARCRMLGVAEYIVKPVSKRSLLRAVMGALDIGTHILPLPSPKVIATFNEARLNILVAEDNAVNQALIVRLLQKHNHQVTVVSNGREAVQHAQLGGFDAILMDVQMPILDGLSATREIRRWEEDNDVARTPIVALTAYALLEDRERCLEAGMDSYLTKPLKAQELFGLLRTVTSKAPEEPLANGVSNGDENGHALAVTIRNSLHLIERDGIVGSMVETGRSR